VYNDDALD